MNRNDPMDALRAQDGLPTTYPVFQFSFRDMTDFTNDQRACIGLGVNSMIALGPTCVWDTRLANATLVVVARWPDDNSIYPGPAQRGNAGRATQLHDGSWLIELDPVGLHGELAWIYAAAHETGHVFGMDHLEDVVAIMNPSIPELEFGATELDEGSIPPGAPTKADFDEYDRVHG